MSGNKKAFCPTTQMEDLLAHMQRQDYDCTITDACKAVGICRRSYYRWFDQPGFAQWWVQQQDRHFAMAIGRVQAAMLKAATSDGAPGSTSDRKLFLERFDTRRNGRGKSAASKTFEQELADLDAKATDKPNGRAGKNKTPPNAEEGTTK